MLGGEEALGEVAVLGVGMIGMMIIGGVIGALLMV
jgi:hypothetical protein